MQINNLDNSQHSVQDTKLEVCPNDLRNFDNQYPHLSFLLCKDRALLERAVKIHKGGDLLDMSPYDFSEPEKYAQLGYFIALGSAIASLGLLTVEIAIHSMPLLLVAMAVVGIGGLVACVLNKKAEDFIRNTKPLVLVEYNLES